MREGATLQLHDPKAMPLLKNVLPEQPETLRYSASPYAAAAGAHALLILTDWPEYKRLDWDRLRSMMELPLVIDGRNLLDPASMREAGFEYIAMGRPEA